MAQAQPYGRDGELGPKVTEKTSLWLISGSDRLPVGPQGAAVCVRVCVCFSLSSFSLQRDSALAAYISQSKSPCGRIEQGVPELTSDGHQPGGSRAGGAGGREGPQGRAGRWTLAGTGLLPALPAPSPCGGQSPLGLGLSQFDSLGLGRGFGAGGRHGPGHLCQSSWWSVENVLPMGRDIRNPWSWCLSVRQSQSGLPSNPPAVHMLPLPPDSQIIRCR